MRQRAGGVPERLERPCSWHVASEHPLRAAVDDLLPRFQHYQDVADLAERDDGDR
jgi:hypothetical protein